MLKRLSCIAFIMALLSPVAILASDNKLISPENVRFIFAEIKNKQAEADRAREAKAIAEKEAAAKKLAERKEQQKAISKKAKNKKALVKKAKKVVIEEDAPLDYSGRRLPDECMAPEDYFDAERDLPKEEVAETPVFSAKNLVLEENKNNETIEKNEIVETPDLVSETGFCQRGVRTGKRFNVETLGWHTSLSGYVKVVENKNLLNSGERIGFGSDVKNIGKTKTPGLRLSYELNERSRLEFNWMEHEQSGMLGAGKSFKGKLYSANSRLETKNYMYDFVWNYKFNQDIDNNGIKNSYIFALLGIKSWNTRLKMDGIATGVPESSSYSKSFVAPCLGVGYVGEISEGFGFKLNINYLNIDNVKKYDSKSYDYDLVLSYRLSKKDCAQDVLLNLGYRQFSYNLKGGGNDIELKNKGPYIGLKFAF